MGSRGCKRRSVLQSNYDYPLHSPKGDFMDGQICTEFGELDYQLTGLDSVHLGTGSGQNDGRFLTVHRVQYYVSMHVTTKDGKWCCEHPYIRRCDHKDASWQQAAKVREIVIAAWAQIANGPAITEKGKQAHLDALHHRLESAECDVTAAQNALANAVDVRNYAKAEYEQKCKEYGMKSR